MRRSSIEGSGYAMVEASFGLTALTAQQALGILLYHFKVFLG
jgi:hypothetical protein